MKSGGRGGGGGELPAKSGVSFNPEHNNSFPRLALSRNIVAVITEHNFRLMIHATFNVHDLDVRLSGPARGRNAGDGQTFVCAVVHIL
jgi:hypothetical protein